MHSPHDIRRTQAQRFAYLQFLYNVWSNLRPDDFPATFTVAIDGALGLTPEEGVRIRAYLISVSLIERAMSGQTVAITRQGIDLVKRALASPDEETQYFPPINILHIAGGVMADMDLHQAIEHLVDDVDKVSGLATHLLNVAQSGKPLPPTAALNYKTQLEELAKQRDHLRTVIARFWMLAEEKGH